MTITAKYAGTCPACRQPIAPGQKVEWAKGSQARHVACSSSVAAPVVATSAPRARNWDPQKFNGYGRRLGGFRRACKSEGNCSSIGSGKSCGGFDCDGF